VTGVGRGRVLGVPKKRGVACGGVMSLAWWWGEGWAGGDRRW
jgi:hypothetical protein